MFLFILHFVDARLYKMCIRDRSGKDMYRARLHADWKLPVPMLTDPWPDLWELEWECRELETSWLLPARPTNARWNRTQNKPRRNLPILGPVPAVRKISESSVPIVERKNPRNGFAPADKKIPETSAPTAESPNQRKSFARNAEQKLPLNRNSVRTVVKNYINLKERTV